MEAVSLGDCTIPPVCAGSAVHVSDRVGRLLVSVNVESIQFLRMTGYTWNHVATIVGVSRSTLWRRLKTLGIEIEKFTDISDIRLDDMVKQIQEQHPNVGQVILEGYLKQEGVCVQRYRIRESIFRTDPIRRSLRWHQTLTRRTYSVKGANSLWHIDGHHSLIRWRFVIHGGIDGYSRLVVFLTLSLSWAL